MKTFTLWLLIHIGEAGGNGSAATQVIERFLTASECDRVAAVVRASTSNRKPTVRCVQATVVRPEGVAQ